jgi:hypothetical protein
VASAAAMASPATRAVARVLDVAGIPRDRTGRRALNRSAKVPRA